MTQDNDIAARIHAWVQENFPIAKQRGIGLQDSLLEGGVIDSLGTLDVVEYLETEFGIEVLDEEMMADHFESVSAMAEYVTGKTQAVDSQAG